MKQSIKNFKQLVFMFNGGAGEFHFLNKEGRMFNLKFIKLNHDSTNPVSLVYTYFNKISTIDSKQHYNHIGRYNFQTKTLELRTDPVIPEAGVKIAVEALGYILEGVNTGKDITKDVMVYYSPRCSRCGYPLTNRTSLERGMGDCCLKFYQDQFQKTQFSLF